MPYQRAERIKELLREEISTILTQEMWDPRLGMVTVTEVVLTPDLRHAKVYVTIYGEKEEQERGLEVLKEARGHIRSEVGRRVNLRYTPELDFVFDTSLAHGMRIVELLDKIQTGQTEDEDLFKEL